MKRTCRRFRDRLLEGAPDGHAVDCPECARLAVGLDRYRRGMRNRHAGVTASRDFAARVRSRLGPPAADELAWAARRLLPVTALLVLLLAIWAARTPSPLDMTPATDVQDLLAWSVADAGDSR